MQKHLVFIRIVLSLLILMLAASIAAVLVSPFFERTSKGGYFNDRDNPDYILLSAISLVLIIVTWIIIELKYKSRSTLTR